jgi:nucleotide-binding universal stress UspA family protein
MFTRIVVGVDGREGGRDALALARLLKSAGGGRITAVRVYTFDHVVPIEEVTEAETVLEADLRAKLDDDLRHAGVAARAIVVSDPAPARALLAVAERERADVLVLGPCHRAGLDRVLAGDVALSTLHGATCAVAVAPRGFADESHVLRLIGVGYDRSAEAHSALRFATDLARRTDGHVRAMTVVAPPTAMWPLAATDREWVGQDESARRAGEELLEDAIAEFGERVTPEVAVGKSWRALASSSGDLDLLVVGSRAHGPVRRVLLGSTSTRLFRGEAACPVLVLPRGAKVTVAARGDAR